MPAVKPRTGRSPAKSVASAKRSATPRQGRPPMTVFINVRVRATTRNGLNRLKRRLGVGGQGEVLDHLVGAALRGSGK